MVVTIHQAVGIAQPLVASDGVRKNGKIIPPVAFIFMDILPMTTASGDVLKRRADLWYLFLPDSARRIDR